MKVTSTIITSVLAVLAVSALAAEKTYKVGGGSPAQQIATVESVTDFETFTGRTNKVSGSIVLDTAKNSVLGTISVDVKSIDTGIPLRNDHMASPGWLDAAKHPTIKFVATKSKFVKGSDWDVTGKLTLHGVTKTVTVRATVKQLAASKATKDAGFKGDVLQLKTKFDVKISDFGVKIPAMAASKVSDKVSIAVTTYAQTG